MARRLDPAQYLLGCQGLALLRRWLRPEFADVPELLASTVALASAQLPPIEVEDYSVDDCYRLQQETYVDGWNPLIEIEQHAVWPLLEASGSGKRALDAACGTGRHAEWLAAHGYEVTGVDGSAEMVEVARRKVGSAGSPLPSPLPPRERGQSGDSPATGEGTEGRAIAFRVGRLEALPLESATFDLSICALALALSADIRQPIAELARVTKPGGMVVISDIHPVSVMTGDSLLFETPNGGSGVTRQYVHWHGEFIDAFAAAGLRVARCLDVPWPGPLWGADWYAPEGEERTPSQLMGDISTLARTGMPGLLVWQLDRVG